MISIESFRKKINKYIKNNNKKSGLKEIKIIKKFIGENYIHQNCSDCVIPHKKKYIKKNFSRDWFEVMKDVRN